jgi:hypothetical protein
MPHLLSGAAQLNRGVNLAKIEKKMREVREISQNILYGCNLDSSHHFIFYTGAYIHCGLHKKRASFDLREAEPGDV